MQAFLDVSNFLLAVKVDILLCLDTKQYAAHFFILIFIFNLFEHFSRLFFKFCRPFRFLQAIKSNVFAFFLILSRTFTVWLYHTLSLEAKQESLIIVEQDLFCYFLNAACIYQPDYVQVSVQLILAFLKNGCSRFSLSPAFGLGLAAAEATVFGKSHPCKFSPRELKILAVQD